jgi:hypothetical protein
MPSAVLRIYDNAPGLADAIASNLDAVRDLLRGVDGFRSWGFTRTESGAFSITVCETKAGCDETVQLAAGWIRDNVPGAADIAPPTIIEGTTVARLTTDELIVSGSTEEGDEESESEEEAVPA